MINKTKVIRKVTMAAGALAMGIGLSNSLSIEVKAESSSACYDYCRPNTDFDCKITWSDGTTKTCVDKMKK